MRKVSYSRWIHTIKDDPNTGKFSNEQPGIFHGWGYEIHEDKNSIAMESVALVEDINTGHMHKVDPNKMRFMQPPELRAHSKDAARVEVTNIDQLSKATMELLMPVLNQINKKLETL